MRGAAVPVDVKLIDGVNHMGIVSAPEGRCRSSPTTSAAWRGKRMRIMNIDSQQAAEALGDIDEIVRRVRQSRIYDLASLMLIMWGALVFAGNLGSFLLPRYAGYVWIAVNVAGVAGSFAISAFGHRQDRRSHLRLSGC